MAWMVVKRTVEDAHITYASFANMIEPSTYILQREYAYRVAYPTHTEGTRIKTAARSLHLHKGLTPGKERTLFGSMQRCKVHYTSKTPIIIYTFIYIA